MNRILFFICALLLLVDLADDGYFGKAPLLPPQCPGKISFVSSPGGWGNVVALAWIPPERLPCILQRGQNQRHLAEVADALAEIDCFFLSSSGGLPL
jgi:hypothetical protein